MSEIKSMRARAFFAAFNNALKINPIDDQIAELTKGFKRVVVVAEQDAEKRAVEAFKWSCLVRNNGDQCHCRYLNPDSKKICDDEDCYFLYYFKELLTEKGE